MTSHIWVEQTRIYRAWRKRLAKNFRAFRRERGRWPDSQIIQACKDGIVDAINKGIGPPVEH